MLTFILAHIGIPLIAGLVLLMFEAAASQQRISWDRCNKIALDLAILSIGANGAIFLNAKLIERWGERTPVYGIIVVLVNLFLAAILVYRKRWQQVPQAPAQGLLDLFLGALALSVTTGVFYFGYD